MIRFESHGELEAEPSVEEEIHEDPQIEGLASQTPSAETVQPETLGAYYDHCIGMGDDKQEMSFEDEEEFFRETGLRLSDVSVHSADL